MRRPWYASQTAASLGQLSAIAASSGARV